MSPRRGRQPGHSVARTVWHCHAATRRSELTTSLTLRSQDVKTEVTVKPELGHVSNIRGHIEGWG